MDVELGEKHEKDENGGEEASVDERQHEDTDGSSWKTMELSN